MRINRTLESKSRPKAALNFKPKMLDQEMVCLSGKKERGRR
jgi:hypothetical protein